MDKAQIDGYIVVTERVSKGIVRPDKGYFKEMISPGAFQDSLNKYGDVALTFNHERVIAEGPDIQLFEDNIGLRYIANIDDIEVLAKGLSGSLKGCSFSFNALKENEENINNYSVRKVNKLKLQEVSILENDPAYECTSINIRSIPESLLIKVCEYRLATAKGLNK